VGSCNPCDFTGASPQTCTLTSEEEYADVTIPSSNSARVVTCRAAGVTRYRLNNPNNYTFCGGGNVIFNFDLVDDTSAAFPGDFQVYESPFVSQNSVGTFASTEWSIDGTFRLAANTTGTYTVRLGQSFILPPATPPSGFPACNFAGTTFTIEHDVAFHCIEMDTL